MLETLIGTVVGGAFRLAPEILKWIDRKDERKHEATMFDKNLAADKLKAESGQALATIEANKAISLQEIQAIIEATKAQAQQSGIKWVDGFNSLIRPLLALQWLILLWPGIIVTGFVISVQHGTPTLEALAAFFGQDEKAMAASIASFWLVDRSLRKPR